MSAVFLEPLDVLFLRGNKLFGDPGSYGESLIPPWPSVAAGALRSGILVDDSVNLAAYARGEIDHPELGTPRQPGSFTVTAFHLAQRQPDGTVEPLYALPADLVIGGADMDSPQASGLIPASLSSTGIMVSASLPCLPVLAETERSKPRAGYWLKAAGWAHYLAGELPASNHFIPSSELWGIEPRVGIGMEPATQRAADGKLFSVQAVAMRPDTGFLVTVSGAELPISGTLRLGGDGRAAALRGTSVQYPVPDYTSLVKARRCRLVLESPGIFKDGCLPTGITKDSDGVHRFNLGGVTARLVAAAVPRAEVVSGWDLAHHQPKPAERAAPAGSVYWLDELDASENALRQLAASGLWDTPCDDPQRRAEGFNRCTFAAYSFSGEKHV